MLPLITALGVGALLLLIMASVRYVPAGHVYSLRRMDGHVRLVGSGTHLVVPLVERVAHKISLAGAAVPVEDFSIDGRPQRAVVYFQVLDPQRADLVIEDVENLLRTTTRRLAVSAELPEQAEAQRPWLKQALNNELRDSSGLLIARVDLDAAG